MQVTLLSFTKDAEILCAAAALGCNSEDPAEKITLTDAKVTKILDQTIKSGHHSILEHATFTFSVSGVSRVLTHQLVRHRMASYSQQSQRCASPTKPSFVMPNSINTNVHDDWQNNAQDSFEFAMGVAWGTYSKLIEAGVPEEDARYVLPGACTTNIVITMNARELLHFFELRMCNRAQWEIREMANQMYMLCFVKAPNIFKHAGPKCWTGKCTEMKPCGHPPTKVEFEDKSYIFH